MHMERDLINATPAYVLSADLVGGAEVTVSRTEAWSGLAVVLAVALVAVAGSGWTVWFAATSA
jgi:hypothetical protein